MRALVLSQVYKRSLHFKPLGSGLSYLAALPALVHLLITVDRHNMQNAVEFCGPLSRLTHLTRFEMTPKAEAEADSTVRHL
jgi:hypothetical protein